jgi:WD40 repeat protein/serine/threonine protein kinase/Tfp pilus assembly protein PilF
MADKPNDIETIYNTARQKLPGAERSAYLDNACGNDAALRARVEALLKADDQAGSFLDAAAFDVTVTFDKSPLTEGPGTVIGPYKLLEKIGEGGMAYVYMAEQERPLRRRVALKIIKLGMDTKQVIARFEAERQALAVMDHPNIAKVFDAGATETGRPYFVMELVKGVSITEYCDKNKLSTPERLDLFIQVCNAVQHAHQKGIIHRDIKPSNVMVTLHDGKPVPKVIDFGIAKATSHRLTEKTLFTKYAQMIGTPEYMSPEQAEMSGLDIDTRADIYSLGVLLYELLTGTTPFDAEDLRSKGYGEMQRIICETEPLKPSTKLSTMGEALTGVAEHRKTNPDLLNKLVRGDLDWIVMKTLEKDRARRYETASALAADIRRHFGDEPVEASPPSTLYRLSKFIRKHRRTVAAVLVIAATLIIGLIVSTTLYFIADHARNQEAVARATAEQAQKAEQEQRKLAEEQRSLAETKAEDLRRALYFNHIAWADASYREGNVRRERELLQLCPADLRGWEWDYLWHMSDKSLMTLRGHSEGVISVATNPDGKLIASGGWDNTIKVWDAATGTELMTFQGHEGPVCSVAFSPDSKHVISGSHDKTAKVWDTGSARETMTLSGHGSSVSSAVYSPDGQRIISSSQDGTIKVWDSATGVELMTLSGYKEGKGGGADAVRYSPDGDRIVSAGGSYGNIKVWDAATGTEINAFEHGHEVWTIALNPDGTRLVSGGEDGTIKVWDIANGKELMVLRGHREEVHSVAFSPDGKCIVSGSDDNTIRIWDASSGAELVILRGHESAVLDVVFSPDGQRIVSGGGDNTVKIWDGTNESENMTINTRYAVGDLAFSPDGKHLVSAGDNMVTIWDVETGVELKTVHGYGVSPVWFGTLSSDGKDVLCCSRGWSRGKPTINVWDMTSGAKTIMTLRGHEKPIYYVSFSHDGKYIVTGSSDSIIKVWDGSTGTELMTLLGHKEPLNCAAFSPDGNQIATGGLDGIMKVWDISTGAELTTIQHADGIVHPNQGVWSAAFSRDGKRIVTGGSNDKVKVWDVVTGSEVMALSASEDGVLSVAFTADGRRIVACGRLEAAVRVWDAQTGTEAITLRLPGVPYTSAAISPDGKTLAVAYGAASYSNTITLFESAVPATEYGPRQTAKAATKLVDKLYEKHNSYREVIDTLRNDSSLDESMRTVALQIANARKGEDVYNLYKESREVLSLKGDPNAYRLALEKAEKASSLEPNNLEILAVLNLGQNRVGAYQDALETLTKSNSLDPNNYVILARLGGVQYRLGAYHDALKTLIRADSLDPNQPVILNTLGMVQYRLGSYEDAMKALTTSDQITAAVKRHAPATVAFIAMSLHKLGRTEEAKAALERLRDLCKEERFAEDQEAQAFLTEAEQLITGEKQ